MNDERRHPDIRLLSRVELIEELHKVEARLRISRCDLARAHGPERDRLRERISRMKTAVQRVRLELSLRNEQARHDFVAAARRTLDPQTFARIEAIATD